MRTLAVLFALASVVAQSAQTAFCQNDSYVEDFDSADPPELPNGWWSPDSTWETSTSVASPGSARNNMANTGNAPGSVMSPIFDLSSVTTATVTFFARRTSTYDSLNLQLEASIDGGATWGQVLMDSTAALPGSASVYTEMSVQLPSTIVGESNARLRFRARRTTGGNVRIDDFAIHANGPLRLNSFGFERSAMTVPEARDSLVATLSLGLISTGQNLQGIQFSIESTNGLRLERVEIASPAIVGSDWHFSTQGSDSLMTVVLISEGTMGLPPPGADPLFAVTFGAAPLTTLQARRDTLRLRNVIASAASAGGDDLSLVVDPSTLLIDVVPLSPILTTSPDTLSFGAIADDSTWNGNLLLSNAGTGVLDVADIFSISGLVDVTPPFLTIPPDSSAAVAIGIAGSDYGLGPTEDWIVIDHNGPTSPDTVAIVGSVISVSTRGDLNHDDLVDILDLVLGIDVILDRIEVPDAGLSIDLHPYPAGNGAVDVRDLTVLAQAIARGVWPDGTTLPLVPPLGKSTTPVGDLVINETEDGLELWVRSSTTLRAIHLIGRVSDGILTEQIEGKLATAQFAAPYVPLGGGSFSILLFGMDVPPVSEGESVLVAEIRSAAPSDIEMHSLLAVDEQLARRPLVTVHESSLPIPESFAAGIQAPYPNPIALSRTGLLHIPLNLVADSEVEWTVADVLGRVIGAWSTILAAGHRVVSWDLLQGTGGAVAPGLYFITASANGSRQTRSIMIL